ncbi:MAG: response regulator transcription factor [Opitutaceae bacterium]|nr:response regulator transcription factor [Opitutaceae bacterium]
MRALRRRLKSLRPSAIVTRQRLADGFSDDVIHAVASAEVQPAPKIAVLLDAGATAAHEARQLALGADSTHRDPVRADVLLAHLAKYRLHARPRGAKKRPPAPPEPGHFAGATMHWADRRLTHVGRSVTLTPREVQLVELLVESRGAVLTNEALYDEVLDLRFDGDTRTLRVFLTRFAAKVATIGLSLREWLRSVPKTGYRYRAPNAL